MWNPADRLPMTDDQRKTLEAWVRARTTPQRIVRHSRICLLAANGHSNNAIASQLGTSHPTVLPLATAVCRRRAGRSLGGCPSRSQCPTSSGGKGSGDCRSAPAHDPARRDPLEHPDDGESAGGQSGHRGPDLGRARTEAPPDRDLQVVERQRGSWRS